MWGYLKQSINHYEKGYLKLKLGDLNSALNAMDKSLKQSLETDDKIAQACANRGMGEIYLALQQKSVAEQYFKKAIELFGDVNDTIGIKEVEVLMTLIEG